MRRQFVRTIEDLLAQDERLVVLLGDIGVFGFRNAINRYPERVYNIGICEQAMASVAAGLAKEGLVPVIHSIAPFVVERCYEQLKVDLCYQHLSANIVSVGSSYDYAALGCTHHCPGDVAVLRVLPGMEIVVPGAPAEFDRLFRAVYADGRPTYLRLSERKNELDYPVEFGRAVVVQQGNLATIIAVGPMLSRTLEAVRDLDVTLLYYTTVVPFDGDTLRENWRNNRILLVEPYYAGVLVPDIHLALGGAPIWVEVIGVPHRFLTNYGHADEHDKAIGFTSESIRTQIEKFINA